ncbi:uncharacterized protein PFL1_00037 [Pseudozyma flocculosa PF-1]|uniref:Uncharacterized protein n=1 Tax=Pseudozyma flocculosa TaxID=84751 RepID=A0A5C3ESG9_9BASI|nr:uncharacterized protein PFL1_00037 [Pseudozyma flocculosa PF-1]EPQ31838.1 hypothetical protein PFL1_00037 [Pseudozyma flocculosa PF-1]SPO35264.1 uncharacterized protein PSFLO_00735 [Pseudozyma flocculosa]
MSFASRYGSSVSRDYALLQGHPASYHHFGALSNTAAHDAATANGDDASSSSANQLHTDGDGDDDDLASQSHDDSFSNAVTDDDGMSNISLPHHNNHSSNFSTPASPTFARSNRGGAPAPHLHPAATGGGPSNGIRRPSVNAVPALVGIPSEYLLGGSAIPPPATADTASLAPSYADIEDIPDETDLPTPMPHAPTTRHAHSQPRDYLDYYGNGARGGLETSSLLSATRRNAAAAAAPGESGFSANYGATSHDHAANQSMLSISGVGTGIRRPSISGGSIINGGPGVSGWATASIAPVPVPGVEQIDSIEHEPRDHIAWREAKVVTQYTIPIWATHLLELSLSVASVFSLGHLGTLELAAASLSSMTANVSGYSVLSGFISALDTILPSAYTQQPKSVGLWTQRMLVIVAGLMPLIWLIWFNAERVLIGLGQDPAVAKLAGQYLSILALGLPGYASFEVCRRYLQAQGLMHAPTLVLLVVSPLNALANYLLVWGPESIRLGFVGAPVASAISMWVMAVLCFIQCVLGPRTAWDGWTKAAFRWSGIRPVLSLGFAGMCSLAAEWWAWEIVGLVTAALGTTALAAQSVLLVSSSVTYQLPFGASVAAAVRIGNLLGANRPREARISSNVSLILSLAMGGLNSALFLIFRRQWGYLFSSDLEVIRLVEHILPILAIFQVADGVCGIAGGVLRGTGRQAQGALINMTAYYLVGIPIGLVLTFSKLHMGLEGLWWGLTIALLYGSVGIFWLILRTDWDHEVRKVQMRMNLDDPAHGAAAAAAAAGAKQHDVEGALPGLAGGAPAPAPNGQQQFRARATSIAGSTIDEADEDERSR